MSTVADVIADVRVEINDVSKTRFSSDTSEILPLVKQAIRRANRVVERHSIPFAKTSATLTTVADTAYVSLPSDFDIPIGIWRDDTDERLTHVNEQVWETLDSPAALTYWFLDIENSRIYLAGTPDSAETLTIRYFPTVDPSAYTTASTMPWSGRLDDAITRYVALRLQNIDEMNVKTDENILTDFENSIIQTYMYQNPPIVEGARWL